MAEFDSVDAVLHELEFLAGRPEHLVVLLARRPGQKEDRWAQLLAAEEGTSAVPDGSDAVSGAAAMQSAESFPDLTGAHRSPGGSSDGTAHTGDLAQRVGSLETQVAELALQVQALTTSLGRLRRSLGDEGPDPRPEDR
jgi:uncharacterized protein YceH (UPF0502 family)